MMGATSAYPRKIVALGGGTGLPAVLRGFKEMRAGQPESTLTAIVAMSDDGGSSGRLRHALGVPPPGDVRNCLVALSDDDDETLAGLFQHRYTASDELRGHSVGNLILAALAERTGCFVRAVETSSRLLRTVGRILPVTADEVTLKARLENGAEVIGETQIALSPVGIERVSLHPPDARATSGVIESIMEADLVVLGPGSLFTSVVPSLIVRGVAEALRDTCARVVLVANLVSERGEAAELELPDHIRVIERHGGASLIDAVLVNSAPVPAETLERYRAEGARPLFWPTDESRHVLVFRRHLLADTPKLRHDPTATWAALNDVWGALKDRRALDNVS